MKYEEKLRIVPVWEKAMLTVDEAVAYSGIGRDKLIELGERESSLILWVGSKRLFKRKKLDEIIENVTRDKMDVDVYYKALTKEIIDQLHAAGIKVNCWTVDQKEDAERLVSWGIDYITTNILE